MPSIIVKGANFSSNRIGFDFIDKTFNLIEKTSAVLTPVQKEGLNDYLVKNENAGHFVKVPKWYLPVLSSDIATAFINIANDALIVDLATPVNPLEVNIVDKGALNLGASTNKQLYIDCDEAGFDADNFSLLAYLSKFDNSIAGGLPQFVQPAASNWYGQMPLTNGVDTLDSTGGNFRINGTGTGWTTTDGGGAGVISFGVKNTMFGITLNQGDYRGGHYVNANGNAVRFYAAGATTYVPGVLTNELSLTSNNNAHMKNPTGMVAMGGALTQEELQNITQWTNEFMAIMGVDNVAS